MKENIYFDVKSEKLVLRENIFLYFNIGILIYRNFLFYVIFLENEKHPPKIAFFPFRILTSERFCTCVLR